MAFINDVIGNLMTRTSAALTAFNNPAIVARPFDQIDADFNEFDRRVARYRLLFAMYQNTNYASVHTASIQLKTQNALYKYIRDIYNPSKRIIDFWKSHLWGGALDPAAGDGGVLPSALPIITDNEDHRTAISELWKWSRWANQKDILTWMGVLYGDVGIKIVADRINERVFLKIVDPAQIVATKLDDFGRIMAYKLVDERIDPANSENRAIYQEFAGLLRDEETGMLTGKVQFATFKDGKPFAWPENIDRGFPDPAYILDLGFVPFVHIQNIPFGGPFGFSELQDTYTQINELNDLVSKTHDHMRTASEVPIFFSGVPKPATDPTKASSTGTVDNTQPNREKQMLLYAKDPQAKASAIQTQIDLGAALEIIRDQLEQIERDHPEIQLRRLQFSANAAEGTIREARQEISSDVVNRRVNYDTALTLAMQMAISIGGENNWEGYEPFNLDSFANDELEFIIGNRPVFGQDERSIAELAKVQGEAATLLQNAFNASPLTFSASAKVAGLSDEEIELYTQRNGEGPVDPAEELARLQAGGRITTNGA
jgi:hypothetical protein